MTETLFRRGFAFIDRIAHEAAGEAVRYKRAGTVLSDALPAILSAASADQILDTESAIVGQQHTWRLDATALVLDGNSTTPRRGDRIEWRYGLTTYVFEVLPAGGQFEVVNTDPRSKWLQVTAKLIERTNE